MSKTRQEEIVDEMLETPQGTRDAQMPHPPEPAFQGEVGPSPTADTIPPGDPARSGGGKTLEETGEEPLAGVADAGGIDAPNTDGMSRTGQD